MIKRLLIGFLIFCNIAAIGSIFVPAAVHAQASGVCGAENNDFLGFPTWYKYLDKAPTADARCELNFDIFTDSPKILLAVFEIILRIGGLAAVGFIIFGGFQYIISQGEPERTKGAKSTILNAVIGLAVTISATAIVNLIGRNIA